MPAQNSAIQPSDEVTGQSALPLARIKKIIQLDDDIHQCSSNATFLISVATEMFIRYLAEQGHNVVKSERKPRKTIQYRDLATAVSRIDNLEFLSDVIPKTTTYKKFKENRAKETVQSGRVEKGQRRLNGSKVPESATPRSSREETMVDMNGHHDMTARPPMVTHSTHAQTTLMVDRTVGPNGASHRDGEDVEMAG